MPIAVHLGVRRGVERKRFHSASGPSTRRARALSTREILEEELRSIVSNQRLRFPEISSDEDPPISNQLLRRLMFAVMRLLWSGCHAERSEFETTEQQITEEDVAIVVGVDKLSSFFLIDGFFSVDFFAVVFFPFVFLLDSSFEEEEERNGVLQEGRSHDLGRVFKLIAQAV